MSKVKLKKHSSIDGEIFFRMKNKNINASIALMQDHVKQENKIGNNIPINDHGTLTSK